MGRRLARRRVLPTLTLTVGACVGSLAGSPAGANPPPAGPTIPLVAGNGSFGSAVAGPATATSIGSITYGMAADAQGNLYLADQSHDDVYRVTPSGTLSVFAGNGTTAGPNAGPATATSIGIPEGLAVDAAGNLYIADDRNDFVYKVTPSGTLSIFAGNGSTGPLVPGAALHSPLGTIDGLAIDPSGNLYIASFADREIAKVTTTGTLSIFAGNGTTQTPTAGPANSTSIGFPEGLAADWAGDLYIADPRHSHVYEVTPGGSLVIFAGDGTSTVSPIAGAATATSIGTPENVAVDREDDVYITDDAHDLVYEVTPVGILSLLAGKTGTRGTLTPGPAETSAVGSPEAIATDPNNDVFVSDSAKSYAFKITPVAPGVPLSPVAVAQGTSVSVSWQAPTSGGPVGSYTVTPSVNGVAGSPVTGVATTSYTVTNPIGATTYTFSISATNGGGTSAVVTSNSVLSHGESGYWEVASDGGIFGFGNANFWGSMGGKPLNKPIVAISPTAGGRGYWEVASDGGIFGFGNANFWGSMGGKPLNKPIVAIAGAPGGLGYWEVASDGGIFGFGNANFWGSMGGMPLNKPIVGFAALPTGLGYWEVASDGGIFAFGTAEFWGSMGGKPLNKPIIGLATTPTGLGYWEVASDGGLFAFGTAAYDGSTGGKTLVAPIVGVAPIPTSMGYLLVASDGGLFAFGDAIFYGSEGGKQLDRPIVGLALSD